MWRFSFVCLLAVCGSCCAWAQAVFSANASAARIGVKDQVQVDYRVENVNNLRSISKPDFRDFIVVGGPFSSQSSNISIVGNKMVQSASLTHSYVLQPRKTGNLVIPPAVAKDASGTTYESNAVTIQVVNGSLAANRPQSNAYDPFNDPYGDPLAAIMQQRRQAMQQRRQQQKQQEQPAQVTDMKDVYKNLFIKVSVDKNKAYVGEQITASYKLYARLPMNVAISKLPSLNGFWTQDFILPSKGNIKPEEEVIDGKRYQVFLLKKSALFPQQTGTLVLDPAEAEGQARIVTQVRHQNPFAGMFDNDPFYQQFGSLMMSDPFFNDDVFSTMGYKDVPVKLKSAPVNITVLPLPATGRPAGFGNAVGNFTVNGKADKTELTTDDALTYTLRITGTGNLKLIEPPKLTLPNGLSTYDPMVIDTITGRTTTITGSKIITYTISPNVPGVYQIPALPFSYYNPQTGSYVTTHTTPVTVHVTKGKHYSPTVAQTKSLTDLHPIIARPLKNFKAQARPIFFTAGYWSMYALPMLAFVGLLVWKRRDEELSRDMARLRNRRANRVALKRLNTAQKLLQQQKTQPFYEEVSKAIWLYLSDKLNIPLSELSREKAHDDLYARHVSQELVHRTDALLTECETALYARSSAAQQMQHTYREAVTIISKMEETL